MYIFIIFFPLINFLIFNLFGKMLKKKYLFYIFFYFFLLGLVFSFIIFYEVIYNNYVCDVYLFEWLSIGSFNLNFILHFDFLVSIMLFIVIFISFLVHLYSWDYMSQDPYLVKFISYLSLFTFFMLFLVSSSNYVQLFLGWEGVGLLSYLLINFWSTRIQANKSAIKAIIVNRFGDFGLYFAICILFYMTGSVDFYYTFSLINIKIDFIDWIVFFLLIAALSKSAQIGLHTWLADAMEGPTPVSALIHAATMVTAGIVLIIRSSFLIEQSLFLLQIFSIIGVLTIFFAGSVGIFQNDIKKIIAFSTCSQLGYMLLACGSSSYYVSLFHLFNHAFFKALLFLCAGSVIHTLYDEQDIRKMGSLINLLPVTYICMFVASLSLMGIPFISGYYSKDLIIELCFNNYFISNIFIYSISVLSVLMTSIYSIRLLFYVFFGNLNLSNYIKHYKLYDSQFYILIIFTILACFSIFSGYIFKDLFISITFTNILTYFFFDSEFLLNNFIKLLPFFLTCFGSFISLIIFPFFFKYSFINVYDFFIKKYFNIKNLKLYYFFNQQWYFNYLYNIYLVFPILNFGYFINLKLIDRGFLEIFGPYGIVLYIKKIIGFFSFLQTGYIFNYLVVMVLFILIILFFILVSYYIYLINIFFLLLGFCIICIV